MKFGMMIGALGLMGLLSGCGGELDPTLVSHKNVVHVPSATMFACHVTKLPTQFNNNGEVAALLVKSYNNNVACANSMQALQKDLLNQQKVFGK